MQLPYTSSNLKFWLDPNDRFVTRDRSGLVNLVQDRALGGSIVQTVPAQQPRWSATAINGTPGLVFSGKQYLTYRKLAKQDFILGSPMKPFLISFVARITDPKIAIMISMDSFYNNSQISISCGSPFGIEGGLYSSSWPRTGCIDASLYNVPLEALVNGLIPDMAGFYRAGVITFSFDGHILILRVNGIQVDRAVVTSTDYFNCDSFSIGARDGGPYFGIDYNYIGAIGHVVIYDAPKSIQDIENVLKGFSNI